MSGAPRSQEDGQELCLACGMCCRGDLYRNAGLHPDELPAARSLRLPIIQDEAAGPAFALPCPKLDGNACTIYDDERKPNVCSSFECKLLKRYLGGEIDLERSLERVREARSLIDRLREEIGRDADAPIWTQLTEWAEAGGERRAETRMRVGQLMRILSSHFLPPVDRTDADSWPPTIAE